MIDDDIAIAFEFTTAERRQLWAALGPHIRLLNDSGYDATTAIRLRARLDPNREDLTDSQVRARLMSRDRKRRLEARRKGFDIPFRKPGPRPRVGAGQRAS